MSSALDEDTARAVQTGRETVGAMLGTARDHLQKVFIVFVVGLMGTIVLLQAYVWDFLRRNTRSQMSDVVSGQLRIITRTPFDVILVQVKIGIAVGLLLSIPLLIYLSRDSLRRRGFTAAVPVGRAGQVGFAVLGAVLFVAGILYAYVVFFPTMFDFLATNAIQAAVKPEYDIVLYVQFLVLLTVSFGVAAQLPLMMSILTYTEIVPYETFRDRWRYAVIAIFGFGAFFSPPDPFTQIMWAVPLCSLYLFSLGLSKLVTNVRRGSADDADAVTVRQGIAGLAGLFVLASVAGAVAASRGALTYYNEQVRPALPEIVRPGPASVESVVGIGGDLGVALFGVATGMVVLLVVILGLSMWVLRQPVEPRPGPGVSEASGDPAEIDLGALDADGVRAAPPEAFLAVEEDEVVRMASEAMDDDDPERAEALLNRFDEVQERVERGEIDATDVDGTESATGDDDGSVFTSTAAGMVDPFTEEETTEDDVGGYYYDVAFILESLTSKAFRVVGVLMATLGVTFFWLYQGGLGDIKSAFFRQVDPELLRQMVGAVGYDTAGAAYDTTGGMAGVAGGAGVVQPPLGGDPSPGGANYIIALHPVEHLIFEVKVATIIGVMATLPVVLYYAWPAAKQRGLVGQGGDRRVFVVWGGSLLVGGILGSLVGFFYVSPAIISFLVEDALEAGMRISYRLNAFMWLVVLTTLGIGLLADIPVTMWLFDRGGIVSYQTMLRRWRVVVLGVFAIAGLALPGGTLTMFIIAVPVCIAYGAGLALLWTVNLPRRLRGRGRSPDDEEVISAD